MNKTSLAVFPLPRSRGRVGVGAFAGMAAAYLINPNAPLPTFPRVRGEGQK